MALRRLLHARVHCRRGAAAVRAMASTAPAPKPKLAVAQMCSTADVEANFATCERLAHRAAAAGAALLALPECCTFLGERDTDAVAVAEPLHGPLMARFGRLARDTGLWLSLGGVPEAAAAPGRRYNTHVVISAAGEVAASYRKARGQLARVSRLRRSGHARLRRVATLLAGSPVRRGHPWARHAAGE
jgi:hypothetical protein